MGIGLDLSSIQNYRRSVQSSVGEQLSQWCEQNGRTMSSLTMDDVEKNIADISKYPRLDQLRFTAGPDDIIRVNPKAFSQTRLNGAEKAYLGGSVFVMDTAGGMAERLGLGSKYLLLPADLCSVGDNAVRRASEDILPITLGTRHKLQYVVELRRLAMKANLNPEMVVWNQPTLTVLNEDNYKRVVRDMIKHDFFGFNPDNMFFLVEQTYSGMEPAGPGVRFSPHSPWRMYNHGEISLESAMDGQIFNIGYNFYGEILERRLTADQFGQRLNGMAVQISYPIEDIAYLTGAINLANVALAMEYGDKGFRMVMELVKQKANSPVSDLSGRIAEAEFKRCLSEGFLTDLGGGSFMFNPGVIPAWASPELRGIWMGSINAQKGGFWAFDKALNRGVVIESDHGGQIIDNRRRDTLTQIDFLNRNFNLYPKPYEVWSAVRNNGLMLHLAARGGYIYLDIPQGDQNFLVPTAYIMTDPAQAIRNLKEPHDIPETLEAMRMQDEQDDFRELAEKLGVIKSPEGKFVFSSSPVTPVLDRMEKKARTQEAPLSLNDFAFQTFLNGLLPESREHLIAASELSQVKGSLVRKYTIDQDGRVRVQTIAETMKGAGKNYTSRAMAEIEAHGTKSRLARESNRIIIHKTGEYCAIDIPNRQTARTGELITLLVQFRIASADEKKRLLADKLKRVCEIIEDKGFHDRGIDVEQLFLARPIEDLLTQEPVEIADYILHDDRFHNTPLY